MASFGLRAHSRVAEQRLRACAGGTPPRTLPPLGRSSSDTVLRCGQAVISNASASRDSPPSLGAGRVDPRMRALLAAAQRSVDPKELPMSRPGSRSRACEADVSAMQTDATPSPPLRRNSSATSLRSWQSQNSPPRDSSANLGVGRIDPTMRALLAAAQRIVDPKGLPASRPGSLATAHDADVSTRQTEATFTHERQSSCGAPKVESFQQSLQLRSSKKRSPQAVEAPKEEEDEEAFVDVSKKLITSSRKPLRERNSGSAPWGTREEICKLNGALEVLGKPQETYQWASPEIERLWLRKETTSQLLQSFLNGTKVCSSNWMDSENSTRAPNSATTSGYATPDLV